MGIFSSKKKYIVNTTVQAMFANSTIPNSIKSGIIQGIMSQTDIRENMMENVSNSLGFRAQRAYDWAKRTGFPFGVPTSGIYSAIQGKTLALQAVSAMEGATIYTDYYKFGPINSIHYAWVYLMMTYGYRPETNEIVGLSNQVGFPVYLSDMQAVYQQEDFNFIVETKDFGVLEQWGPAPSSGYTPTKPFNYLQGMGIYAAQSQYTTSTTATEDTVTVKYEYKDAAGVIQHQEMSIGLGALDTQTDYHQIRYKRADGTIRFWTYRNGSGTYPALDNAYAMNYNDLGTYLPWCYFRKDGIPIADLGPYLLNPAKEYAKKIGVDYDTVNDGIHADPDVDDVQQAIMMFGVNPGAVNQSEIHYLFEYFSTLHLNSLSQMQLADNLAEKFGEYSSSPSQVIHIQDMYFSMSFQYSGITKVRLPGRIAATGKFTSFFSGDGSYTYRKQTLDSMYEEITVWGLVLTYNVSSKKGFSAMAGQPELLVPVDRAVLSSINVTKKEDLLARALYMVINTQIVQKTPWYAASWFKAVMIVVAVVITILSAGTMWQTLAAAAALGASALAITVLTMIVSALAMSFAVKLFVRKLGPEIGIFAAIAAMAFAAYASSADVSDTTAMWGENMLSVGNNLVAESEKAYTKLSDGIMEDMAAFNEYAKGQFDSLEEQREALGLNHQNFAGLESFDLVSFGPRFVYGEAPTDYYSRTVHSGNIGVACYDLVEGYTGYMLQLPTINSMEEVPENGVPEHQ